MAKVIKTEVKMLGYGQIVAIKSASKTNSNFLLPGFLLSFGVVSVKTSSQGILDRERELMSATPSHDNVMKLLATIKDISGLK